MVTVSKLSWPFPIIIFDRDDFRMGSSLDVLYLFIVHECCDKRVIWFRVDFPLKEDVGVIVRKMYRGDCSTEGVCYLSEVSYNCVLFAIRLGDYF